MAKKKQADVITIDGTEYELGKLSDSAKEQIVNIQFVDARIQQLQNEWAVSDTARIGYSNELAKELTVSNGSSS